MQTDTDKIIEAIERAVAGIGQAGEAVWPVLVVEHQTRAFAYIAVGVALMLSAAAGVRVTIRAIRASAAAQHAENERRKEAGDRYYWCNSIDTFHVSLPGFLCSGVAAAAGISAVCTFLGQVCAPNITLLESILGR